MMLLQDPSLRKILRFARSFASLRMTRWFCVILRSHGDAREARDGTFVTKRSGVDSDEESL
jgi:hypothetical protein